MLELPPPLLRLRCLALTCSCCAVLSVLSRQLANASAQRLRKGCAKCICTARVAFEGLSPVPYEPFYGTARTGACSSSPLASPLSPLPDGTPLEQLYLSLARAASPAWLLSGWPLYLSPSIRCSRCARTLLFFPGALATALPRATNSWLASCRLLLQRLLFPPPVLKRRPSPLLSCSCIYLHLFAFAFISCAVHASANAQTDGCLGS